MTKAMFMLPNLNKTQHEHDHVKVVEAISMHIRVRDRHYTNRNTIDMELN